MTVTAGATTAGMTTVGFSGWNWRRYSRPGFFRRREPASAAPVAQLSAKGGSLSRLYLAGEASHLSRRRENDALLALLALLARLTVSRLSRLSRLIRFTEALGNMKMMLHLPLLAPQRLSSFGKQHSATGNYALLALFLLLSLLFFS